MTYSTPIINQDWQNPVNLSPHYYNCGYCGANVASTQGFLTTEGLGIPEGRPLIYLCAGCRAPTFFCGSEQTPAPAIGSPVSGLPGDVDQLYTEARRCTTVGAYTSAVMTCRKLIMHIAVDKKASEGQSFSTYISYLADNHYLPPEGEKWADELRKQGNEANHEIVLKSSEDASLLLGFAEFLLRFIYEFPARLQPVPNQPQADGDPGASMDLDIGR